MRELGDHEDLTTKLEGPSPSSTSTNISKRELLRFYMSKLGQLEQKVKDKIQQANRDMHPAHNSAYIENLKIEIEALNWVLNEILVVSRLT